MTRHLTLFLSVLLGPKGVTQMGLHPQALSSWGAHLGTSIAIALLQLLLSPKTGPQCQITVSEVSNLLASLATLEEEELSSIHTLNTKTLTKIDEQKKRL